MNILITISYILLKVKETIFFINVHVIKDKERLWKCFRLKDNYITIKCNT